MGVLKAKLRAKNGRKWHFWREKQTLTKNRAKNMRFCRNARLNGHARLKTGEFGTCIGKKKETRDIVSLPTKIKCWFKNPFKNFISIFSQWNF